MKVFKDFEKKLESVFEGVLLRAFKTGVHPVEMGKKLVRELEGNKTISALKIYVPNRYEIGLSPQDYERFETYQAVLATELENLLISYIREKGYALLDRPRVRIREDEGLHEGEFWIETRIEGEIQEDKGKQKKGRVSQTAEETFVLELLDKNDASPLFVLTEDAVSVGRSPENEIVLPDPNVSRVHAKIEHEQGTYFVVDLDSTNGTFVNDKRVRKAPLRENDIVRMGSTKLLFRGS
ncbi:MAG: DUF3662 and FHA domain-containing protein [Actinomycetota bacterium]|nr:DUF3662 and FHA domain-containing protein [Actinomycetota bacterium]